MIDISGVYEIAIRVKDLAKAEPFYMDLLGLKSGLRDERRNWHFLWVGGSRGMVVLQEDSGEWPPQHFAFTVSEQELERAKGVLEEQGVETQGPITHDWAQARSLYFADPDGHQLELLARLN